MKENMESIHAMQDKEELIELMDQTVFASYFEMDGTVIKSGDSKKIILYPGEKTGLIVENFDAHLKHLKNIGIDISSPPYNFTGDFTAADIYLNPDGINAIIENYVNDREFQEIFYPDESN